MPGSKRTRKLKLPRGMRQEAGRLYYRFRVKGHEYAGPLDSEATVSGLDQATRRLVEIREMVKGGRYEEASITPAPFNSAVTAFLDWKKGEAKASTVRRLQVSTVSLVEYFQGTPVHAIHAGDVETYKAWRRSTGIKEITLVHDLQALRQIVTYSRKQRWCSHDPLAEVSVPRPAARREFVLDAATEATYLAAARQVSTDLADFAELMLLTGMRNGELLALRWASVDFEAHRLTVEASKTSAGRRVLPIAGRTLAILLRRRLASDHCCVFAGGRWASAEARQRCATTFQRAHERALGLCGQSWVLYSLRHTAISRWVNGDERSAWQPYMPVPVAARLAGHTDIRTTMRYVHVSPEAEVAAIARWAAMPAENGFGNFLATAEAGAGK